jgi:hypothetical protein
MMMRRLISIWAVVALGLIWSAPAQAKNKKIRVTVVDVAGGVVYLKPGAKEGIRVGQKVAFGKRSYRITGVNGTSASFALGKRVPKIGSTGSARVPITIETQKTPPKPLALASYQGQWQEASKPAHKQNPERIPIASLRIGGPTELSLSSQSSVILPLSEPKEGVARGSVRARLRAEPFQENSFGVDVDAEIGRWFGRGLGTGLGSNSRPLAEIQELRLRYGQRDAPQIGIGRLRYAANSVGMLDGVRLEADVGGGLSVFGFGGLVPRATDGRPSADLSRFGAGLLYANNKLSIRPEAELAVYASSFDGELDEQRATMNLRAYPGPLSIAGYGEVSMFDNDNEWGAARAELTSAGLDTRVSHGQWSASVGLSAQQPERSRWLASLLPPSWLCTAEVQAGAAAEACNGHRDYRYFALGSTSYRMDRYTMRAGAASTMIARQEVEQLAGFLDGSIDELPMDASVDASLLVSQTDLVDSWAVRVGARLPVSGYGDFGLYYRPGVHNYRASVESINEHRIGSEVDYAITPNMSLQFLSEVLLTDEVGFFASFLNLTWNVLP